MSALISSLIEKRTVNTRKVWTARHSIPRGTLLLFNTPMFSVPDRSDRDCPHSQNILDAFSELSNKEKSKYLDLRGWLLSPSMSRAKQDFEFPAKYDETRWKTLAIWFANAIDNDVYYEGSHSSHSCTSNLFSHNNNLDGREWRAVLDIKKGTVLTIPYIDVKMRTRSQRPKELKQYHGFTCQCWICTQGKEKVANSDATRLQIGDLVSKVLEEHRRGDDADFK
jgi:hypothetical protein